MKVNKSMFDLSEDILSTFEAKRLKSQEIDQTEKSAKTDTGNKWDKLEKQMDKEEKIKEIEDKDFDKEAKDKFHKMMGCSKDHAAEIDIYNKTYPEKIERVKLMKE